MFKANFSGDETFYLSSDQSAVLFKDDSKQIQVYRCIEHHPSCTPSLIVGGGDAN